jgi:hypothetical protein
MDRAQANARVPEPIPPAEDNTSKSLLQQYAGRGWTDEPLQRTGRYTFHREVDPTTGEVQRDDHPMQRKPPARMQRFHVLEPAVWELPFHSKRMVAALLTTAAADDLEHLSLLLTPDAHWGLPDTRMMQARPVFADDHGEAFLAALRGAAGRFPGSTRWVNPMLVPGVQASVRSGAEPYWTYYDNGIDRIYLRHVVRDGEARFDYVGLFREAPRASVRVVGKGEPPPVSSPLRKPDGSIMPAPESIGAREGEAG